MKFCYDSKCTKTEAEHVKVYTRYPDWLFLPDTIVEHCRCGKHNRVWSQRIALSVFARNALI